MPLIILLYFLQLSQWCTIQQTSNRACSLCYDFGKYIGNEQVESLIV